MNNKHMTDNNKIEETVKVKDEKLAEVPKKRQIIIETDGISITLVKAEVAGTIELVAILQNLIAYINKSNTEVKPK